MKRRLLSVILAGTMALGLLTACGGNDTAAVAQTQDGEAAQDAEADAEGGADSEDETDAYEAGHAEITGTPAEQTYFPEMPTGVEDSSIYVEKIDGLSEDFIRGMDISSLLAEEESGVKYYDADGNEADLLKILADAGINCVRVRVWNDPFDADGNGYGGGNCTARTAAEIGARAAAYGIKLCVDFHYSDFWADPNKQFAPKAWEDMDLAQKSEAIRSFTHDSLAEIINAGADVYMVQIGNEINTGMAGETDFDDVTELLRTAADSVRDVSDEWGEGNILVAVHYTNIDDPDSIIEVMQRYSDAGLKIDVFGVSYYPYWHGTLDNLTYVLKTIHETYGVDTCVMETSYMYTADDGDGSSNSVSEADELEDYPIGVQGQANCVRDVMAAAAEADALGVFYWEGAWIPVGSDKASNSKLWEEYGSGWASSYAAEYDPDDAGQYYGGSSWDNQTFFDNDGNRLDSLDVFKYVYYGAVGQGLEVLKIKSPEIEIGVGETLEMPETVDAVYNDTSVKDGISVEWDADEVKAVDTSAGGAYEIHGETVPAGDEQPMEVTAYVTVADINYLANPGFEEDDTSMWIVESETSEDPTDIQDKAADAYDGSRAFHYWSEKDMEFTMSQEVMLEQGGTYTAECYMQGGDFDADSEIYLFVTVDAGGDVTEYKSDAVTLDGWVDWKNPIISDIEVPDGASVTVGVYTKACAKSWATYDAFCLHK